MEDLFEEHEVTWRGQVITVRWCPNWTTGVIAHLEIVTADRAAHPISETGYKSHFCPREQVEEMGGPVAYVTAWLELRDDGKPVQLSLF
jgi:hypothetical protein